MQTIKNSLLSGALAVLVVGCGSGNKPGNDTTSNGNTPATGEVLANGATVFTTCTVCHGEEGQGNTGLGAPAIAGREAWYIASQLRSFRLGYRGTHQADTLGNQMAVIAKAMQETSVEAVASYVAGLPPIRQEFPQSAGNVRKGASTYNMLCGSCHGQGGTGNQIFQAPSLILMDAWYIDRQLHQYMQGIRGTHPDDIYGAQMVPMAKSLNGSEGIADVVAFIQSLQP